MIAFTPRPDLTGLSFGDDCQLRHGALQVNRRRSVQAGAHVLGGDPERERQRQRDRAEQQRV